MIEEVFRKALRCRGCGSDWAGGRCAYCGDDQFLDVIRFYPDVKAADMPTAAGPGAPPRGPRAHALGFA
jgi:hypothetical protein